MLWAFNLIVLNKFYLNFEFYLHVEKSSEVQLRKEKIKASLNFFISFLPRDFKTLQNLTLNQFPWTVRL